jgi:hypothetical protein
MVAGEEAGVTRARLRWPTWIAGVMVACITAPAGSQDNIDAGKSPAQMFADTCSACHRRPQELRRASAGFLRRHYTTGPVEASAMAAYLAKVGSDPRAIEQRRERAKVQSERGKPLEAGQQPKGRRTAETGKPKTAARPAETSIEAPLEPPAVAAAAAEQEQAPPPAPQVVLEPFEE